MKFMSFTTFALCAAQGIHGAPTGNARDAKSLDARGAPVEETVPFNPPGWREVADPEKRDGDTVPFNPPGWREVADPVEKRDGDTVPFNPPGWREVADPAEKRDGDTVPFNPPGWREVADPEEKRDGDNVPSNPSGRREVAALVETHGKRDYDFHNRDGICDECANSGSKA